MLYIFLICFSIASSNTVHRSVLQSKINSLDPILASDTNTQLIINNSWDGLIHWDPENGLTPVIAETWSSKNSIEFQFVIKKDLKFQDNTALSCLDIKNHFERLKTQDGYYKESFNIIQSVSCIDDKLNFKLKYAYSRFPYLLAGVPGKIVKFHNNKIIGHGPYQPTIYSNKVILNKNPLYKNHLSNVDSFIFNIITDENIAIETARRNELHDISLLVLKGSEINNKHSKWLTQPMWATWIIGLDQRVPPLNNKDIRCRFISRVNDDSFRQQFFPNSLPAYNFIPFSMPGYSEKIYSYEIKSELREHKKFEIYIPSFLRDAKKYQKYFKEKFASSNINVEFIIKDFNWIIQNYAKGVMPGYLLSLNAEFPDVSFLMSSLHSTSSSNFLGIKNQDLDNLLSQDETNKTKSRNDLYKKINELLSEECSLASLMHVTHYVWMQDCISGLKTNPISEGYFNYRQVINKCKI